MKVTGATVELIGGDCPGQALFLRRAADVMHADG
jgi:hypothetical protein